MNFGPSIIGGLTAGVMLIGVNYVMPEPAFISIRELSYTSGYVTLDRAIRPPNVIADFQVVIVDDETGTTVCHGSGVGEYESSEGRRWVWPLDFYVGEEGCLDRLDGDYNMYTTWSPRDGRRPVQNVTKFNTSD
jgi:hypothetical protein